MRSIEISARTVAEATRLALEQLNALIPALVVLDLNLPHVTGESILHYIRAQARLAKTRAKASDVSIFLVTGCRRRSTMVSGSRRDTRSVGRRLLSMNMPALFCRRIRQRLLMRWII